MNLPTRKQCDELFKEFHTPQGIIDHCTVVNKVANFIALKLKQSGEDINLDLVDRASLLHDLLRMCDMPKEKFPKFPEHSKSNQVWEQQWSKHEHCHHAEAAAKELENKYPQLAVVIKEHLPQFLLTGEFSCLESKIVHYSDKRVDFDKIVSLEKRKEEGMKRWKTPKEELEKSFKLLKELETELFNLIGEDPNIIDKSI